MRIAFVLPAPVRVPGGGAFVVYQHAAGLARRGHEVTVYAPRGLGGRLRSWAARAVNAVQRVPDRPAYSVPDVRTVEAERLEGGSHDTVIATGIQTFAPVRQLGSKWGRKVSFVQGDETFITSDARASWSAGVPVVTCARWLADAVAEAGGHVLGVVPNAPSSEHVALDAPVAGRAPFVLGLYHRHPVKGPDVLLDVYARLAAERPDVRRVLFAARQPSHRLPGGTAVEVRPSADRLRRLYASAAVFLHTSRHEGWGLAPMEAAASGCAVVATPSRGVNEFLTPEVSMLQPLPSTTDALVAAVLDLLAADDRREALAERGREAVAAFSWDDSTGRFEEILLRLVAS